MRFNFGLSSLSLHNIIRITLRPQRQRKHVGRRWRSALHRRRFFTAMQQHPHHTCRFQRICLIRWQTGGSLDGREVSTHLLFVVMLISTDQQGTRLSWVCLCERGGHEHAHSIYFLMAKSDSFRVLECDCEIEVCPVSDVQQCGSKSYGAFRLKYNKMLLLISELIVSCHMNWCQHQMYPPFVRKTTAFIPLNAHS